MEDHGSEKGQMKKILRHIFGWTFIVLGIAGLFLPFLQGILFIVAGVSILSPDIPLFHRIMARLERRYPEVFKRTKEFSHNFALWLQKKIPSRKKDIKSDSDDRQHG